MATSFVPADRAIEYQQRLDFLTSSWAERIESFAQRAVQQLLNHEYSDYADNPDPENLRIEATEVVTARLLHSAQWDGIAAVDISDAASLAVYAIV